MKCRYCTNRTKHGHDADYISLVTSRMKIKEKKLFHVEDWAGNTMNFGEFESFDDAWEFIREKFPNEEDWQEYYVFQKGAK